MIPLFRRFYLPAALALAATLGACGGSFRVVRHAPNAGEVSLSGDVEEARAQAEDYMRRQCPEGHDVVDEGEAVVGSQSSTFVPAYGRRSGVVNTMTSDIAEWRIRYRCKDEPAPGVLVPVPRPATAPVAPAPAPPEAAPTAPIKLAKPAAPAPSPATSAGSSWGTSIAE